MRSIFEPSSMKTVTKLAELVRKEVIAHEGNNDPNWAFEKIKVLAKLIKKTKFLIIIESALINENINSQCCPIEKDAKQEKFNERILMQYIRMWRFPWVRHQMELRNTPNCLYPMGGQSVCVNPMHVEISMPSNPPRVPPILVDRSKAYSVPSKSMFYIRSDDTAAPNVCINVDELRSESSTPFALPGNQANQCRDGVCNSVNEKYHNANDISVSPHVLPDDCQQNSCQSSSSYSAYPASSSIPNGYINYQNSKENHVAPNNTNQVCASYQNAQCLTNDWNYTNDGIPANCLMHENPDMYSGQKSDNTSMQNSQCYGKPFNDSGQNVPLVHNEEQYAPVSDISDVYMPYSQRSNEFPYQGMMSSQNSTGNVDNHPSNVEIDYNMEHESAEIEENRNNGNMELQEQENCNEAHSIHLSQSNNENCSNMLSILSEPGRSLINEIVEYTEPESWISIAYYEKHKRVGSSFSAKSRYILIDGFMQPHTNDRFCLGYLDSVERDTSILETRKLIGKGARIYYINGEVFLECLSDRAVFVQSPNCNQRHGWHPSTVCKVPSKCSLQIFSNIEFAAQLAETIHKGFDAVYTLSRVCTIRISFVKGWGADYHYQTVNCTPCWIDVQLNGPLMWVDRVLQSMGSPNLMCSSNS